MELSHRFDFKSDALLSGLSSEDLKLIDSVKEKIKFQQGDKLFYEDGIPTGIFEVVSGKVKKYKTGLDGKQQIFYIYTKNDLFGYHALLSEERYQDSCEAIEEVEVYFISKKNFSMLIDNIPQLKDKLLFNMAHEFGVLANIIAVLAQKSQNIRLGLFILVLQKRFAVKYKDAVGLDISREDLANMIGTSRESLSRSLNFLKTKKLISVEKRIIKVINEQKLENFILKKA